MATVTRRSKKQSIAKNGYVKMPPDIVPLISAREHWTEQEFVELDDNIGAWMTELVDGRLELR